MYKRSNFILKLEIKQSASKLQVISIRLTPEQSPQNVPLVIRKGEGVVVALRLNPAFDHLTGLVTMKSVCSKLKRAVPAHYILKKYDLTGMRTQIYALNPDILTNAPSKVRTIRLTHLVQQIFKQKSDVHGWIMQIIHIMYQKASIVLPLMGT